MLLNRNLHFSILVGNLEFKEELMNKTVNVGETVVFKCKLHKTKIPPRITWYKDGKIIQPGHAFYKIHLFRHSSRMKIRHIKAEDSGKYTCHAFNFITNISTHSWVTVLSQGKKGKKTSFSFESFQYVFIHVC